VTGSESIMRVLTSRAKVEAETLKKLLNASTVCVSLQYGYVC